MQPVGSVLREKHPDLLVSKQRLRKVERIDLIRRDRDDGGFPLLAFTSRPFVLCGLPIRRPPAGQLLHERRNGNFVLQVTGHPEFGLPFGQDRLVPIFLATLAVRQKSQTVRFRSAAEILELFGMSKGGKEYRRLVAAFERIFGATIFFGTDHQSGTTRVVHRARFNFMREATIWYADAGGDNMITLSDEFYAEISAHPIPTNLDVVRLLAPTPGAMDLYVWLSYRCFTAKGSQSIPLFGPNGLAHQLGCVEYSRPRKFRQVLEGWLELVRACWPECPARLDVSEGRLLIQRANVAPPQRRWHELETEFRQSG